MRGGNLLVLDEPTNDLDLETLDLLQEMLADYQGTVLLVSHDRDFLDRVVTSTVASSGHGRWIEYAGGYSDMILQRGPDEPSASADRPSRADRPAQRAPRGPAEPPRRRGLSFKEKHALQTLPARMEALQTEIAGLQSVLADTGLYARDPAAFDGAAAGLQRAERALAAAEEEWLTLELKREEMERA
jgi:ATP-binding cassette subfamily F protein uup